jgi:tetratricopeptide (TPR) repeat protein
LFYRGQTIKSNPNLGIMFAKTPKTSSDLKNSTNYFFNGLENYYLKDYKRAIEINPNIKKAYYKSGISKKYLKDYETTKELLKTVLELLN